jgi:acetylornithine deacetylase/succinyl-diaminopimelate desuccinylase-like protein
MRAEDSRITIEGAGRATALAGGSCPGAKRLRHGGHARGRRVWGVSESGLDYGEAILRPSLNVTQLLFGGSGEQRNAIDSEATAGFDLRLVPGMTVAGARAAIEAHVKKQGYVLLSAAPTAADRLKSPKLARIEWVAGGYPASMSAPDNPASPV